LLDHFTGLVRCIGFSDGITFNFQLRNLRKHEFQSGKQTRDLGQCIWRYRIAKGGLQLGEPAASTLKKGIVFVRAQRRENGADPIYEADTLGDQLIPLPDTPPRILMGFVWDRHHRTDAGLTAKPGKQSAQQQLGIDAVRFGAAHSPVHRYTRRLDDVHLYVMRHEPSRQPKPAPSGLVAGDHALDRAASGISSGSVTINRRQ
jgi:hypothetical protein